ncbi:UBX domain-containing protein 11 [Scomber japonicus]|uniref:UBX domain-containing protein 11 n=1 Tax=Scomber japonicus TaxID=13676 RepID=UPI00230532A9|nr:UBX domain-containing protein 11 [Scomber japonicus]
MSSPLSMLKKTRRTPLQGSEDEQCSRHRVPFRRNLLTGAPPSDFELMSTMMQRLTLLEKKVRSQEQEIEHKNKRISVLEKKLRAVKESGRAHDVSCRVDLERICHQLQNQVHEMEGFLSDYGLIWVGDGECEQTQSLERDLRQPGTYGVRNFHMNFDLVQQRIKELNILAGEGEYFVQSTATGAQLAKKDPIQLRLYRNGIVMFDGPFRSYGELSTQQCMQDLMDGYFPSELQERFPDGVPFEVHDKRDEEFIFSRLGNKFPGEGKAVSSRLPGNPLTIHLWLTGTLSTMVKPGRVIDIRVRTALQDSSDAHSSDSVILIHTPALQAMKERLQTLTTDRPSSARDVITLKVKSEDGNHTYILKMCLSETISHLKQYLDRHRGGGLPDYDIISAYPQCCYDDDSQTLQSCGLTSNATLLMRKKTNK